MKNKIVRTPNRAEGGITPDEKNRMDEIAQKWIGVAMRTDPIEPDKIVPAIEALYAAAGLKKPRVIIVPSPIVMAFAYGASSWILHCREQNATDAATFDATDAATRAATDAATHAATFDATFDATYDATNDAPRAATDAATRAATDAATYAATRAATHAATYAATFDATYDATNDVPRAATRAATDAATRAATDAATHAATHAATDAATNAATYAATRDATYAATHDATYAATDAATRDATDAATNAATDVATRAATDVATYAATYDATDAATRDATYAATRDATYAATRDATRAATDAATHAATYAATFDATDAATNDVPRAATRAATRDATRDATDAATDAATNAATPTTIELTPEQQAATACKYIAGLGGLKCAERWWSNYQGGNMWAAWASYLQAARDVLGLRLPSHEKYQSWEDCALHGGFRILHNDFCMVSDFPAEIHKDEQNRPHNEFGPSHRWRDGWSLYHWHGVKVPEEWIIKKNISASEAINWPNVEQRRAACEIIGWAKVLDELDARVIDTDDDAEIGVLLEAHIPDSGKEKFLSVKCGTGRRFVIPVPPHCKTAHEANAWTYGLDVLSFKPEVRT